MARLIVQHGDLADTIFMTRGDIVEVRLDENPSTGYSWELVTPTTQPLQLTSSVFELPTGGTLGATGQRRLTFAANGPGSGLITLQLRRSWDLTGIFEDNLTLHYQVL